MFTAAVHLSRNPKFLSGGVKMRKGISLFLVLGMAFTLVSDCNREQNVSVVSLPTDVNGIYTAFSDLPQYSLEEAVDAGIFVTVAGTREGHGYEQEEYNTDRWEKFLRHTEDGKDDLFRSALFYNGNLTFTDIVHIDGKFYSINSERCEIRGPFKYLRRLSCETRDGKEYVSYVLTDSLSFTADELHSAFLSSDLSAWNKVPPFVLGITEPEGLDVSGIYRDLKERISVLLNDICGGTDTGSDPCVCMERNRVAFDSLVALGQHGAEEMINLIRDGKNGSREYVAAAACAEITGFGTGKNKTWQTASEWLDGYEKSFIRENAVSFSEGFTLSVDIEPETCYVK